MGPGAVWFLATNYTADPFAELPLERGNLFRNKFDVANDMKFAGVRVLLLTRIVE